MASILGVETLQHSNGTTAATIDSSGRILQPAKPAFNVYRNAGDVASVAVIVWDQVTVNIGSCYNNSDGKFTAPVSGTYFFSWFASKSASAGGTDFGMRLYVNGTGSTNIWSYQNGYNTNEYGEQGMSGMVALSTGDYVQIYCQHGEMFGSGNSHNNFSGFLIG